MTTAIVLRTLSFPAPAKCLTMNQRLHWAAKNRLTQAWRSATAWHALAHFPRSGGHLPPCIVDIALPVKDNRRRDPSGWHLTAKACVDGLVDAGWWPDDNSDWLTVSEPVLVVGGDLVTITVRAR